MTTTLLLPGTLLDFLRGRTTGPATQENLQPVRDTDDLHDADQEWADQEWADQEWADQEWADQEWAGLEWADADADLMDRLQEMYASALPGRLAAIARGTRSGDAAAVESAAQTLAGTSGQLGHPEVASVCQAIARDARRGILAHGRLAELQALARD